jgi:hypothetical protein
MSDRYAEKYAAARLVAEMLNLPELRGSPAQIRWAVCIRDEKLQQIGQVRAQVLSQGQAAGLSAERVAAERATLDAAVERLAAERQSAAFWIDYREATLLTLLRASGDLTR